MTAIKNYLKRAVSGVWQVAMACVAVAAVGLIAKLLWICFRYGWNAVGQ